MSIPEIIGILVLSFLLVSIFYYGFRRTGPWGSFWTFFLVLILGLWMLDVWVEPIGPVDYGVPWLDLIVLGLLLALLLAAASPTPTRRPRETTETEEEPTSGEVAAAAAVGLFFWIFLLVLVVLILLGLFA